MRWTVLRSNTAVHLVRKFEVSKRSNRLEAVRNLGLRTAGNCVSLLQVIETKKNAGRRAKFIFPEAAQDLAFRAEIEALVVDPRRVRDDQSPRGDPARTMTGEMSRETKPVASLASLTRRPILPCLGRRSGAMKSKERSSAFRTCSTASLPSMPHISARSSNLAFSMTRSITAAQQVQLCRGTKSATGFTKRAITLM